MSSSKASRLLIAHDAFVVARPSVTTATSSARSAVKLQLVLYGLGIVLLIVLMSRIGIARLAETLNRSRADYILGALVVYVLGQVSRGSRWSFWLRRAHPSASRKKVWACYALNAFISNLTPGRAGEAMAPALLRARCGVPIALGAGTVLIDRMLDVTVLCALLAGGAALLMFDPRSAEALQLWFSVGAGFMLAALLLAAVLWNRARKWPEQRGGEHDVTIWALRARELARSTRDVATAIASPQRLAIGLAWTVGTWVLDLVALFLMINAVVSIDFVDNAVCQVAAASAALVSFVPGGIGVTTASYAAVAHQLGYDWHAVASGTMLNLIVTHSLRGVLATCVVALGRPHCARQVGNGQSPASHDFEGE